MSCPDCFMGHVHSDETKGKEIDLHGRATYTTGPEDTKEGIVVVVSDAFGWTLPNTRIWADHISEKTGYRVLVPDFMDGHYLPTSTMENMEGLTKKGGFKDQIRKPIHLFHLVPNFASFLFSNRPSASHPKVKSYMQALRGAEAANLPLGVAGFCWGGKHTVLLCQEGATYKPQNATQEVSLVDAGFTAHPSLLSIPNDISKVVYPLSIAIGDKDFVVNPKQTESMRHTLEARRDADSQVVVYPGAGHGFAVRHDPGNEKLVEQAAQAEEQAVAWFKKHFAEREKDLNEEVTQTQTETQPKIEVAGEPATEASKL